MMGYVCVGNDKQCHVGGAVVGKGVQGTENEEIKINSDEKHKLI